MANDILLIVPAGWVEFQEANDLINSGATPPDEIAFQIAQQSWGDIETFLRNAVLMPEGKVVVNARLIQTETGYRFWVVFA